MELILGDVNTVENPSVDDIRHYLQFMPTECPFVILSDEEEFIQCVYEDFSYRVEYQNKDGKQYFTKTDYQMAVQLFLSFLARDNKYRTTVPWQRLKLSVWTTPYHPYAIVLLCAILIGFIVLAIWEFLREW